jgi:hypothetical protein
MKYFTTQKPKTNHTPIRLFFLWISVVWFFSQLYFFSIATTTDWKRKRFLIYFPLLKFSSIEIFFLRVLFLLLCVYVVCACLPLKNNLRRNPSSLLYIYNFSIWEREDVPSVNPIFLYNPPNRIDLIWNFFSWYFHFVSIFWNFFSSYPSMS